MDDDSPGAGLHILANQPPLLKTFLLASACVGYLWFTVHWCCTNVPIESIRGFLGYCSATGEELHSLQFTHQANATDATNKNICYHKKRAVCMR